MVSRTSAACCPPITEMRALGRSTENGLVGPSAHSVISRPKGTADDDGELGDGGIGDGHYHLGPVLAIPPASYWRPTMKPVMFGRNSRGIPRWLHNSMKWLPFSALSEKRTPLLATTPTGYPQMREKPQTRFPRTRS